MEILTTVQLYSLGCDCRDVARECFVSMNKRNGFRLRGVINQMGANGPVTFAQRYYAPGFLWCD